MNCKEARKLLSEYIDNTLTADCRQALAGHLGACVDCARELESLRTAVGELAALTEINAPQDFLAQVHKRLEQRFSFKRLLHFLFLPLKFKLPLELATVAVTVIVVVAVLKNVGEEEGISSYITPDKRVAFVKKTVAVVEEATAPAEDSKVALQEEVLEKETKAKFKPEASMVADKYLRSGTGEETARMEPERFVGTEESFDLELPEEAVVEKTYRLSLLVSAEVSPLEKEAVITRSRSQLAVSCGVERSSSLLKQKEEDASPVDIRKTIENSGGKIIAVSYNEETGSPELTQVPHLSLELKIISY